MKEHIYRDYGTLLTYIGVTMILTHILAAIYSRIYFDPGAIVILAFLPLGLILIVVGGIVRIKYSKETLFLTKIGEPIHSGKPWYEGFESGLYLTSCGLVVSINQDSQATAHVGYHIVSAKHATHRECVEKEGGAILEKYAHGRAY